MSIKNVMRKALVAGAVLVAGCGGGGGGGVSTLDPGSIADDIASKITVTGAVVSTGDLPEALELDTDPKLSFADETIAALLSKVGFSEDIPLKVEVAEGSVLDALFAKVSGSSTIFTLETEGSSTKRLRTKAEVDALLTLNLGQDLDAEAFCVDIVARDDANRASKPQRLCVGIPDNTPGGMQPLANAGAPQAVRPGDSVFLRGFGRTPEGSISSFAWTQASGPSVATTGADSAVLSFVAPDVAEDTALTFQLAVTDSNNRTATDIGRVFLLAPGGANQPPRVEAGPSLIVNGGQQAVLRGDARDIDGQIASFAWTQTGGPTVSLTGANTATARFIAPAVDVETLLDFRLTVRDDAGADASDNVQVRIRGGGENANLPPVANAGVDRDVVPGGSVTLTGGGSTDPDGTIAAFRWTQIAGPVVALTGDTTASPSFVAPDQLGGPLRFRLVVTDNQGAIDTDVVDIFVVESTSVQGPVAAAGPDQTVVADALVTLDGRESFNPEGGPVTLSWSQIAGPTVSLSDGSAAQPTFVAPAAANGTVISFQLTVTNNSGQVASDQVDITIDATSAVEPSRIQFAVAAQTVEENAGQVRVRVLVDPPSAQSISLPYTITGSATSGSDFNLPASPLVISAETAEAFIDIAVQTDAASEPDETVILTLGDPSSGEIDTIGQFTLTITDTTASAARDVLVVTDEYILVSLTTDNPGATTNVELSGYETTTSDGSFPVPIGLDQRPSTGEIYLMMTDRRLYTLNAGTGVLTLVATLGPNVPVADYRNFAFDPCTDTIRLIGSNRENVRVRVDGSLVAVDTDIAFAPGDVNENGFPGLDSITFAVCANGATTAFVLDTTIDGLTTLGNVAGNPQPASSGRLFTVGAQSIETRQLDVAVGQGLAYAITTDGQQSDLVRIALDTGAVTSIGPIVTNLERTAVIALVVLNN